jgi:hypothetical protein
MINGVFYKVVSSLLVRLTLRRIYQGRPKQSAAEFRSENLRYEHESKFSQSSPFNFVSSCQVPLEEISHLNFDVRCIRQLFLNFIFHFVYIILLRIVFHIGWAYWKI